MIERAVVIPVHNEEKEGLAVLLSILAQLGPDDRMVVISTGAKGGPGRPEVAGLTGDDPRVLVVDAPGAYPGRARNEGIRAVPDARIIVQVDAGWQVDDNWLDGISGPIVQGRADCVVSGAGPFAGPEHLWGIVIDREAAFAVVTQAREPREGDLVGGCPVAYRRELWECVGGFDETLRYGEDKLFASKICSLGPGGCHQTQDTGKKMSLEKAPGVAFVGEVRAYWQLGPTVRRMLRREFSYSRHDFSSPHVSPSWRSLLIGVGGLSALSLAAFFGSGWVAALLTAGAIWLGGKAWMKYKAYRAYSRTGGGENRFFVFLLLGLLYGGVRLSRLCGSLAGAALRSKAHRDVSGPKSGRAARAKKKGTGVLPKILRKIRNLLSDHCTLDLLSRSTSLDPPALPRGMTVRDFRDSDIPLFAPYFANLAATVERWKREDCHGCVMEKDGEAAGCYWWTDSHAFREGPRKPFLFDVHLGPKKRYYFAILVREGFRGRWLPAALFHFGINQMREAGIEMSYFYHDAAIPAIGRAWRRYGAVNEGQLRFRRFLFIQKRDCSALRLLCE